MAKEMAGDKDGYEWTAKTPFYQFFIPQRASRFWDPKRNSKSTKCFKNWEQRSVFSVDIKLSPSQVMAQHATDG